jgi:hypothetical protein
MDFRLSRSSLLHGLDGVLPAQPDVRACGAAAWNNGYSYLEALILRHIPPDQLTKPSFRAPLTLSQLKGCGSLGLLVNANFSHGWWNTTDVGPRTG